MSALHTALVSFLSFLAAFAGVVTLNVAYQLLWPKDPTRPPVVFHYVPWIGSAVGYGMDPYKFLFDNRDKYGPVFTYHLLGRWITVSLGPLGNDWVLNGKLAHVNAEKAYTHLTTPVFGTEVVYDVPNHILMEQKKFVKFGLTTDNFKRYVGLIRGEVLDYISGHIFDKDSKTTSSVDAFTTSSEITICTASATLQGKEVRAAMDKSFAGLYHDLDGGFTPINFVFPNLPLPSYRRRDRAQLKMREFYISILERRRASDEEPDLDMITALQNQTYKSGEPLTDKQIAHIMIALLMAGQHTSAATGSWAILTLGDRKDVQDALYAEQVEYHSDGAGGLKDLTYENYATPLLMAFIKEILRLHPPLHSLMREVVSDCSVPSTVGSPSQNPSLSPAQQKKLEGVEYVVPKGFYVLAAPGCSMIDEKIWGEDAKTFNEQRWLDGTAQAKASADDEGEEDYGWGKISKGGKSAYLPFGAGRHRCIGEQFANVQLGTIIATLVREMTWTIDQKFPGDDYTTMIVMPQAPRNVTFKRRTTKA
ncbi:cytochrome P450, family 51 (sterol 14-demethylase) [Pseudohyphozyma bogoriensis]|nr:cytochrome P450, family 51 (sterol 14-demethylase) [Pseudohyphozyma bogoriensis]